MVKGEETLAGIDILGHLPDGDLDDLAGRCRWRRYGPGQQIVGHQDETNDVFFIVEGEVRVTIYSLSGKTVEVATRWYYFTFPP